VTLPPILKTAAGGYPSKEELLPAGCASMSASMVMRLTTPITAPPEAVPTPPRGMARSASVFSWITGNDANRRKCSAASVDQQRRGERNQELVRHDLIFEGGETQGGRKSAS
jgi:hypothetical protein